MSAATKMTPATMMYQFMLMRLGCRDMRYILITVAMRDKIARDCGLRLRPFCGGAAGNFLFDVGAEIFTERCGGGKFVKVAHGDLRKKTHYGGERRCRMSNERHANVVVERPARMVRDSVDNAFVGVGIREDAKNLSFV